jgi:twitching motility protein PilT
MDITELLAFSAKKALLSDLHLSWPACRRMIRVDGDVRRINLPPMEHKEVHRLIYDIMNDKQRGLRGVSGNRLLLRGAGRGALPRQRLQPEPWRRRGVPDHSLQGADHGGSGHGPGVSRASRYPRGLVLVTGPTGSGKSTTLAAMVDYINDNRYEHILTIEDPIEFVHESKKCLVNQREVHRDTHGFSRGAALGAA